MGEMPPHILIVERGEEREICQVVGEMWGIQRRRLKWFPLCRVGKTKIGHAIP